TSELRRALQSGIEGALKDADFLESLKFNITIPLRGLKSLNEALNNKIAEILENNVDFSNISVSDEGKVSPITFNISSENMQKLVDAVRDRFFDLLVNDNIIQIGNVEDIKPFVVNTETLREAILKIQRALKGVEERLNKELESVN